MELFRLFGTIAVNNSEANQNIDETTNKAESSESRMAGAFKKIGGAVAAYFTFDAVKNFGTEIVNASAEVSAEASAFSQIMGDYSDEASAKAIASVRGLKKTAETKPASSSYKVRVTTAVLNVRNGAGTNYKINRTVKQNEVYTIVETKGDWGKLKSGAGWISLKYTKKL